MLSRLAFPFHGPLGGVHDRKGSRSVLAGLCSACIAFAARLNSIKSAGNARIAAPFKMKCLGCSCLNK